MNYIVKNTDRIKHLIRVNGFHYQDLADTAGLSTGTINRVINGGPTTEFTTVLIASALKVNRDSIFKHIKPNRPTEYFNDMFQIKPDLNIERELLDEFGTFKEVTKYSCMSFNTIYKVTRHQPVRPDTAYEFAAWLGRQVNELFDEIKVKVKYRR